MSRRPSTRQGAAHSPPPSSSIHTATQGDVPLTPDVSTISKIKLRINHPAAPVLAPPSSDIGEPESSPPQTRVGGRATRRAQGRPNYREVPVDDLPSPIGKTVPSAVASASETSVAPASKYFPRPGGAGVEMGVETRRRRASAGSGTSRVSSGLRNGEGQSRVPPGVASGRRSTRSHVAEEEEEDGDVYEEARAVDEEEDAQGEEEEFGEFVGSCAYEGSDLLQSSPPRKSPIQLDLDVPLARQ